MPVGTMRTTTLDTLMRKGTIDLSGRRTVMKIDVEGFEPYVVGGGGRFFETTPPSSVVSEISVNMITGTAEASRPPNPPAA